MVAIYLIDSSLYLLPGIIINSPVWIINLIVIITLLPLPERQHSLVAYVTDFLPHMYHGNNNNAYILRL